MNERDDGMKLRKVMIDSSYTTQIFNLTQMKSKLVKGPEEWYYWILKPIFESDIVKERTKRRVEIQN